MSEPPDGESRVGRRTYLKGLAATGLTASLAGCIDLGRYEASIVGLDPDWVNRSRYVSADYRKDDRMMGDPEYISATFLSHAVTYEGEDTDTGPSNAFGAVSMPLPKIAGYRTGLNPYADKPIGDLLESETARPLLGGLGINVGSDVKWETGPIHEAQPADEITLIESKASGFVLSHGVLRTGGTLRAVVLHVARAKRKKPTEERRIGKVTPNDVLFVGSSLQKVVEEGEGPDSLRRENGQTERANYTSTVENLEVIDPNTDLEGLS